MVEHDIVPATKNYKHLQVTIFPSSFTVVQAAHPALNMDLIARTNPSNLLDYYPLIEDPAIMIVNKMEESTDAELRARVEQEMQM